MAVPARGLRMGREVQTVLRRASFGARCGRRSEGVIGPWMARIAALHFGFDCRIAAAPEAGKVARHLHRPMRGRQQVEDERNATLGNRGMAVETEQLLHANCDLWSRVRPVIDCNG